MKILDAIRMYDVPVRFFAMLSSGIASINIALYFYPNINVLYLILGSCIIQAMVGFTLKRFLSAPLTLYDVIDMCPMRRRNGPYYCGVCPQGYECAKKGYIIGDGE